MGASAAKPVISYDKLVVKLENIGFRLSLRSPFTIFAGGKKRKYTII